MDDVAAYFDLLGEPVMLAGTCLSAIVSEAGAVELDGAVVIAPTAEVPATAGAAIGQELRRGASTYTVRQVVPQPPDAAIHLLVLAKV